MHDLGQSENLAAKFCRTRKKFFASINLGSLYEWCRYMWVIPKHGPKVTIFSTHNLRYNQIVTSNW